MHGFQDLPASHLTLTTTEWPSPSLSTQSPADLPNNSQYEFNITLFIQ